MRAILTMLALGLLMTLSSCSSKTDQADGPENSVPSPSISSVSQVSEPENDLVVSLNLMSLPLPERFEEMIRSADAVVLGRVLQILPHWEKAELDRPLLYSYIKIEVEEAIKGEVQKGRIITLRNVGGQLGDRRLEVSHVPVFHQMGERVLVFLRGEGVYSIPFGTEGKLLVHRSEGGDTLEFLDSTLPLDVVKKVALELP